jgi:hypothetical protein
MVILFSNKKNSENNNNNNHGLLETIWKHKKRGDNQL